MWPSDEVQGRKDTRIAQGEDAVQPGTQRSTAIRAVMLLPIVYCAALVVHDGLRSMQLRVAIAIGGVSIALLSSAGPSTSRWLDATSSFAFMLATLLLGQSRTASPYLPLLSGLAVAVALNGVATLRSLGGLARTIRPDPRPLARSAAGLSAAAGIFGTAGMLAPRHISPAVQVTFGIAAGVFCILAVLRIRLAHSLELEGRERAIAFSTPALLGLVAPTPLLAADFHLPVALAALTICVATLFAQRTDHIARAVHQLVLTATAVLFAVVAILLFWMAERPLSTSLLARWILLPSVGMIALAMAHRLTEPRRLNRLDDAISRALAASDPTAWIRDVLRALRESSGSGVDPHHPPTPVLITLAPPRRTLIGISGELASRATTPEESVPEVLLALLQKEPLGIVRLEVLEAMEVRRPDLRPALALMRRHESVAAVALFEDGEIEGVLLMPEGSKLRHCRLPDAQALAAVGRAIVQRVSSDSALERARLRAEQATRTMTEMEVQLDRSLQRVTHLEHALDASLSPHIGRFGFAALRGYAPESRALFEEIDALALSPRSVVIVHAPGTDPLPFAARLHRASQRRGAFLVVSSSELTSSTMADTFAKANGGTLVLIAAEQTNVDVQQAIVTTLALRTGNTGDLLDVRVVLLVGHRNPSDVTCGSVSTLLPNLLPLLAARLVDSPIRIPRLAARLSDLRSLCLARLGALGADVGLGDDALALLVEHDWPGDEAELDGLLAIALERVRIRGSSRIGRRDVQDLLHPSQAPG